MVKRKREYITNFDKSFKTLFFLNNHKILNQIVIYFFDATCKILRAIFNPGNVASTTIGILSFHRLGDTVFTIPAIREIYNHFKDSNIIIFTYSESKPIYEFEFASENIINFDKSEFLFRGKIASRKVKRKILRYTYMKMFDITGSTITASILYNVKAKNTIGINLRYFKNLYTTYTPIRSKPHFMDIYMDVIKCVIQVEDDLKKYEFGTEVNQDGRIAIHPFAIRESKEWGLNNFIKLALMLNKEYDVEIISPPGYLTNDDIWELSELNIKHTITGDILNLIKKITECIVFISNDSGPTYMASLLRKPTFTIYGPTNPAYSLPYGKEHKFIQYKLPCSAYKEKFCFTLSGINCPSNECMNVLSVNDVFASVKLFLDELQVSKTKGILNW